MIEYMSLTPTAIVPILSDKRAYGNISEDEVKAFAIEKYQSNGNGITFKSIVRRFLVTKSHAQRSSKYFHTKGVLFTADNLLYQGINLIQNRNPQHYFPACIKSDIIEKLSNRRSVLLDPTEVSLSLGLSSYPITSKYSNSNPLQNQKAQSFLDVLVQLPFAPLYLHKLQLMLFMNEQCYKQLEQKERHKNRAKIHIETITRRCVTYTFSPNGTVEIAVRSNEVPFKLETDEDENVLFSFLGAVRDRLVNIVGDIGELQVPSLMHWTLKQCDLNKDIEISDKAHITLPDIELKYACRVFRLYVKSLRDKSVYRAEESLSLNQILPEALENIRHPYKSLENKLDELSERFEQFKDLLTNLCNSSRINGSTTAISGNWNGGLEFNGFEQS